jgi:hypothetical protein
MLLVRPVAAAMRADQPTLHLMSALHMTSCQQDWPVPWCNQYYTNGSVWVTQSISSQCVINCVGNSAWLLPLGLTGML